MSQPSRAQGAYSWTGTLKSTNIRQLYERCQRLRLTGKMQLQQGEQSLELVWIGGEPIETESDQGTRSLPLWNNGEFKVEQCIPDWKGRLTGSVELSGPLKAGQIQAIYKLCADNQLSADVELGRANGEAAQVRFTLGKAEAATIAGQTESALTALSKLSAWTEGTFRVVLRPLFGDVQAAEAPVFSDKERSDDQFDVTGSMDIARSGSDWPPRSAGGSGQVGQPVPMGGPRPFPGPGSTSPAVAKDAAPAKDAAAKDAPSASGSGPKIPPRLATTLVSGAGVEGLPSSALPTQPMSTMSREQAMKLARAEASTAGQAAGGTPPMKASSAGRTLAIISIVVIVLCGLAVGGLVLWKQGLLGGLIGSAPAAAPASAPAPAPGAAPVPAP